MLDELDLPAAAYEELVALTPETYIGLAAELAQKDLE